jgi:phosphatidylglycerophosphatase C
MASPVPADAPAVAAFDLDGTLTDGGSVVAWLTAVAGATAVRRAIVRHALPLLVGAVRSGADADEAKEALFAAVLQGRELKEVDAVSADFAASHVRRHVRPEVLARLAEHLEHGHAVVVVSASPTLYVAKIAGALGAHGAAATDLAVVDGRLTGRYEGANCRGAEKLRKVTALLTSLGIGQVGVDRPLYAYGNSRGDLRLLAAAQRPVDVSRLGRLGRLGRYPRLAAVPVAP